MTALTLEEEIKEALKEAMMMESAHAEFNRDRVLETAQRLSHAPFSFVEQVANGYLPR